MNEVFNYIGRITKINGIKVRVIENNSISHSACIECAFGINCNGSQFDRPKCMGNEREDRKSVYYKEV